MEPQMNTVECVVKGHTAFTSNIFSADSVNHYMMMNICWCSSVVSLILAIAGALMFDAWIRLDNQDHEKKSVFILLFIVFILEVIIAIAACIPFTVYSIFFIITMIISSLSFSCYMRCKTENANISRTILAFFAVSTLFMSFHHLIWIVFGVLTEPFWAVPILVVACSFCFSVYVHAYYNFRAFPKGCDIQAVCLSAAVIISLLLFFFITGVVSQSFLSSDPVFGLIQSALVVVATLWMSYVKRLA